MRDADLLAEIQARAAKATPGPWCTDSWEIYQGTEYTPGISQWIGETCRGATTPAQDRADAEFIAHARADVPWLTAEVHRLQDVIARQAADKCGMRGEIDELRAKLAIAERQLRQLDAVVDSGTPGEAAIA